MPYTAITRESRHPFETYLLTAGVVGGVFAVIGDLWPTSIEAALPFWLQVTWGIFLGGGASIALVGIAMKDRASGILLEQVGLVMFGVACGLYAIALLIYNRPGGLVTACLFTLLCAASLRQWWRLEKFLQSASNEADRRRWGHRGRK